MSDATTPPKRPTFLSVLCVLTWLFASWMCWFSIQYIFTDKPQRDLEKERLGLAEEIQRMEPEDAANPLNNVVIEGKKLLFEEQAEHAVPIGWMSLIYTLLVVCSVFLMWQLKRMGLWLLIGIQVPGFILPFFWITPTWISLLGFGTSGFLWVGLTILFALNIKHLR